MPQDPQEVLFGSRRYQPAQFVFAQAESSGVNQLYFQICTELGIRPEWVTQKSEAGFTTLSSSSGWTEMLYRLILLTKDFNSSGTDFSMPKEPLIFLMSYADAEVIRQHYYQICAAILHLRPELSQLSDGTHTELSASSAWSELMILLVILAKNINFSKNHTHRISGFM